MERKLPKNVRQIGNVSDNPKIYIEDYVDTFFIQLCEQAKDEPQGAFLIGDVLSEEGQDYIFVYGAVRMHDLKNDGKTLEVSDETWKKAYEDCKQYFEDGEMLGWFLTSQAGELTLSADMKKIHKKSFPKKNTILILEEAIEREESYYANKYNELMHIAGHYVYYEKNPSMQNYMISCRKKNGVSPSETVEDRAAKDFRSLVRTREEAKEQKKVTKFLYVASGLLLLIVLAMGITTLNNFDKMKNVESTVAKLTDASKKSEETASKSEETASNSVSAGAAKTIADAAKEAKDAASNGQTSTDSDQSESAADENALSASTAAQNEAAADSASTANDDGNAQGDAAVSDENGSNGIYVVEAGDTLAMISQKCYGNIGHVDAICRMNGLSDGNLIYVGQKLLLP